jgi:neutral ceramidase
MARSGFIIGLLVSASLGLLLLLQVIASIDLGQSTPKFKTNNPILQQASRADDSVFLLGAGKADITGYVFSHIVC